MAGRTVQSTCTSIVLRASSRAGATVSTRPGLRESGSRRRPLKAHEGATYESASVLDRLSATLRVRGGIVLNRYVGGLNPAAVEASLRLGGSCVWFPTVDADAHARAFGSTGAYPAQRGGVESQTGDLSISPRWQTSTIAEAAALLLRAQSLYEHGVPQAELRKALVDTPAGLLDR